MRVTFVSAEWSRNGGVASYLQRLALLFSGAGHDVQVVHADRGAAAVPGVRDDYVPGATDYGHRRAYTEETSEAAMNVIRGFAPDVVHVQSCNNFHLEQQIRAHYRAIKTLHVYDFCPSNTKFHHAIERECGYPTTAMCLPRMGYLKCTTSRRPNVWLRLQRRATATNLNNAGYARIVVASQHVRRHAIATGYLPERVSVVPYFVTDEAASAPEPRVILAAGRLVREKGIDLLFAALAQVPRPWRAIVAGEGLESRSLRTLAQRYGLSEDVEFAGWHDEAGMRALLRRASIVAVPSRWPEPSGIIGLEAMAHGRPVVAFETGGIPEWLVHGETGLLVPPLDVPALASSIAALLDDDAHARQMGEAARTRARRLFAPEPHLAALTAIYRDLPGPR